MALILSFINKLKTGLNYARWTSVLLPGALTLTCYVGDITDIPYAENPTTVTAVLSYCKRKILRPYLRLLSVMGLRPFTLEPYDTCTCLDVAGYFYLVIVIALVISGYVLQYMTCFRRDRGFCYKKDEHVVENVFTGVFNRSEILKHEQIYEQVCQGSAIFGSIIPSCLHLLGYFYAINTFRSSEDDHLPSLMERVFLSSSNLSDGFLSQKKLVKRLWIFVAFSILWMILSLITVNILMAEGKIKFIWIDHRSEGLIIAMEVMLVICTLWHDMIQATIIASYCLQAQLLTSYLQFLRAKLLEYPMQPTEWMREIAEFKKLLRYLNEDLAPVMCFFIFINLCWSTSGIVWLLGYDQIDKGTLPIFGVSQLNIGLWIAISLAPFIQAARLTAACKMIKDVGHEVRTRPFAHQDTSNFDLDSLLMYSSSLHMTANLYRVPITGQYLCAGLTAIAVCIVVLGQCHLYHSY